MSSTDPFDSDDGWADLARELELDRDCNAISASQSAPVEPTADSGEPAFAEGESNDSELFDAVSSDHAILEDDEDGDEDGEAGTASAEDDGEDGGTKKRRRRRRRRKKKSGTAEANTEDRNSDEESSAIVTEEVEESPSEEYDDEGTTPEMTRELIRTWNVPSWEEIVTGLYRPQ